MQCLDCGAEMEQGVTEYEFTSETERAKKGIRGFFTRQTIDIPSVLGEHPAWHCSRCRKVLMWVDSKE